MTGNFNVITCIAKAHLTK